MASSLTMVPVAVAVPRVALVGDDSFRDKVSSGSTVKSPATITTTDLAVSPAAKVMVPLAWVKSDPAVAVIPAVV